MQFIQNRVDISSRSQFNALYDPVNDFVFLFSAISHRLLAANKAFWLALDIADKDKSREIADILPLETALQALKEEEAVETTFRTLNGHIRSVQLKVYPATFDNHQVLLGVAKDLPNQKEVVDQLKMAEAEKESLLNEVYHRVKNNLNIIVSLLSLQINRIEEPSVRHILLESRSRVFALAYLQQKLYESPRISKVLVKDYIASLGSRIVSNFKPAHKDIRLISSVENCWLDVDSLVPLGLITNELVTNSVVHAFPSTDAGTIHLILKRDDSGQFIFQIKDNGIGLQQGNDLSKYTRTLGFQLILSLTKQLDAHIEIGNGENNGLQVSFYFNVTSYECP